MDDALETRGIKYLNTETWLLFAPRLSKFLATRLPLASSDLSYESTYILLVDFDLFNRHNQRHSRGQHYTAVEFVLLLNMKCLAILKYYSRRR